MIDLCYIIESIRMDLIDLVRNANLEELNRLIPIVDYKDLTVRDGNRNGNYLLTNLLLARKHNLKWHSIKNSSIISLIKKLIYRLEYKELVSDMILDTLCRRCSSGNKNENKKNILLYLSIFKIMLLRLDPSIWMTMQYGDTWPSLIDTITICHSSKIRELLTRFGISPGCIVDTVKWTKKII